MSEANENNEVSRVNKTNATVATYKIFIIKKAVNISAKKIEKKLNIF